MIGDDDIGHSFNLQIAIERLHGIQVNARRDDWHVLADTGRRVEVIADDAHAADDSLPFLCVYTNRHTSRAMARCGNQLDARQNLRMAIDKLQVQSHEQFALVHPCLNRMRSECVFQFVLLYNYASVRAFPCMNAVIPHQVRLNHQVDISRFKTIFQERVLKSVDIDSLESAILPGVDGISSRVHKYAFASPLDVPRKDRKVELRSKVEAIREAAQVLFDGNQRKRVDAIDRKK